MSSIKQAETKFCEEGNEILYLKNVLMKLIYLLLFATTMTTGCYSQNNQNKDTMDNKNKNNPVYSKSDTNKVTLKEEEWKRILSPEVYQVAREKGTERPFSSQFDNFKEVGTYYCAACGNPLFKSDTKFESGCGWPSFYEPISKSSIIYLPDNTLGMKRTEVECGRCKAHLGHVFEDGPLPTGLRYCINGVVLDFEKAKEAQKKYNAQKE
jgi:peptide-methionine (R)-S-oxide reductase